MFRSLLEINLSEEDTFESMRESSQMLVKETLSTLVMILEFENMLYGLMIVGNIITTWNLKTPEDAQPFFEQQVGSKSTEAQFTASVM
jgi:hypothetical protein